MKPTPRFHIAGQSPEVNFMQCEAMLVKPLKFNEFRRMIKEVITHFSTGGNYHKTKDRTVFLMQYMFGVSPEQEKFWAACVPQRDRKGKRLGFGYKAGLKLCPDNMVKMTADFCIDGQIRLGGEPGLLPFITKLDVSRVRERLNNIFRQVVNCGEQPVRVPVPQYDHSIEDDL